jgi:glutaredoxin 3
MKNDKHVVIYSTPTCTYCNAAKQFFNEHSVAFEEHNVAEDAMRRQEMIEKSGQMGVPVITIDDKMIIGFDEEALKDALGV